MKILDSSSPIRFNQIRSHVRHFNFVFIIFLVIRQIFSALISSILCEFSIISFVSLTIFSIFLFSVFITELVSFPHTFLTNCLLHSCERTVYILEPFTQAFRAPCILDMRCFRRHWHRRGPIGNFSIKTIDHSDWVVGLLLRLESLFPFSSLILFFWFSIISFGCLAFRLQANLLSFLGLQIKCWHYCQLIEAPVFSFNSPF